jgi:hypothetical protein
MIAFDSVSSRDWQEKNFRDWKKRNVIKERKKQKKQKKSPREIDTEPDCTKPLAHTVFPRSQPIREEHEYAACGSSQGTAVPLFFPSTFH